MIFFNFMMGSVWDSKILMFYKMGLNCVFQTLLGF